VLAWTWCSVVRYLVWCAWCSMSWSSLVLAWTWFSVAACLVARSIRSSSFFTIPWIS
jgi:hypothetical protein